MLRVLTIAVLAVMPLALTGCTGTWDTLSSRTFRKDPLNTTYRLIRPEDPMVVLRADPPRSGDERVPRPERHARDHFADDLRLANASRRPTHHAAGCQNDEHLKEKGDG